MNSPDSRRSESDSETNESQPDQRLVEMLAELAEELTAHPHDALIKRVLTTYLDAAKELFCCRLRTELATAIDWSTLRLEPASFVKRDLKRSHSDLLFSVKFNERRVLIYLLFEHQSTIDASMPLRLLGSQMESWFRHREQQPSGP